MRCRACNQRLAARVIGLCAECLRQGREVELVARVHPSIRRQFGLPEVVPRHPSGRKCSLCANECRIGPGQHGYCGLRENVNGRLVSHAGVWQVGHVQWYYDPLPTNCVASWVCPEGESSESLRDPVRRSWRRQNNLAVFYEACTLNCLFCQNWTFHVARQKPHAMSAAQLAARVDERTACICFFGGDPAAQMLHALRTADLARQIRPEPPRICWETNGSMNAKLARRAAELSLRSGGCVKLDLKAWNESLHRCLTGASNRRTLENFRMVADLGKHRRQPPLVVASTLLLPGYLDDVEIVELARFIASIDPEIPYSLLAFHPDFFLRDLPTTSRAHAERALAICREAGLQNVRIGNRHLLSPIGY
jgi:pyruvate formate lyase activating enzyme